MKKSTLRILSDIIKATMKSDFLSSGRIQLPLSKQSGNAMTQAELQIWSGEVEGGANPVPILCSSVWLFGNMLLEERFFSTEISTTGSEGATDSLLDRNAELVEMCRNQLTGHSQFPDTTLYRLCVTAYGRYIRRMPFKNRQDFHYRVQSFLEIAFVERRPCFHLETLRAANPSATPQPNPCVCNVISPALKFVCRDLVNCRCPGHRFQHTWGSLNMTGHANRPFVKVPSYSRALEDLKKRMDLLAQDPVANTAEMAEVRSTFSRLQSLQSNTVHLFLWVSCCFFFSQSQGEPSCFVALPNIIQVEI